MSSRPAFALAPLPKSEEAPIRLSVVLPAMDETWSLRETVERIEVTSREDVQEYIIVVCKHTTKECRATAEELSSKLPGRVQLLEQTLPFLGGAVRDAFSIARGSHVVLMGSDLETDPATLPMMVDQAKRHRDAVITATRLKDGVRFHGYSRLKLV